MDGRSLSHSDTDTLYHCAARTLPRPALALDCRSLLSLINVLDDPSALLPLVSLVTAPTVSQLSVAQQTLLKLPRTSLGAPQRCDPSTILDAVCSLPWNIAMSSVEDHVLDLLTPVHRYARSAITRCDAAHLPSTMRAACLLVHTLPSGYGPSATTADSRASRAEYRTDLLYDLCDALHTRLLLDDAAFTPALRVALALVLLRETETHRSLELWISHLADPAAAFDVQGALLLLATLGVDRFGPHDEEAAVAIANEHLLASTRLPFAVEGWRAVLKITLDLQRDTPLDAVRYDAGPEVLLRGFLAFLRLLLAADDLVIRRFTREFIMHFEQICGSSEREAMMHMLESNACAESESESESDAGGVIQREQPPHVAEFASAILVDIILRRLSSAPSDVDAEHERTCTLLTSRLFSLDAGGRHAMVGVHRFSRILALLVRRIPTCRQQLVDIIRVRESRSGRVSRAASSTATERIPPRLRELQRIVTTHDLDGKWCHDAGIQGETTGVLRAIRCSRHRRLPRCAYGGGGGGGFTCQQHISPAAAA
jgi:hypothetical protein